MEGPAARSSRKEASNPNRQAAIPNTQPIIMRCAVFLTQKSAATAGMVNSENTSKTPAILTAEVTTIPKVV